MKNTSLSKLSINAIIIAFQLLPVLILFYNSHEVSQWNKAAGWVTDTTNGCACYTSENAAHRNANWTGECIDGKMSGLGTLIMYEAGLELYRFNGQLKEGRANGPGRIIMNMDGDIYEGVYKDGKLQGYGYVHNDDGDRFHGQFNNGERHGAGTFFYEPDHEIFKFEGLWKNNLRNGPGKVFYSNGKIEDVHYENGHLVNEKSTSDSETSDIPKNILITNDDGVEDLDRLICLAEAVSSFAEEVIVVASSQNRSGTSNLMSVTQKGFLESRLIQKDDARNIEVYEVDGYPADCVLLGSMGIFGSKGKTVDLVISGINGGPNHGAEWFGSGTVGAARTAALGGVPAIAISGIDEDNYTSVNRSQICSWVSRFIKSGISQYINPQEYLTVSIPKDLSQIQGVKVVPRAITFNQPPFEFVVQEADDDTDDQGTRWMLSLKNNPDVYDMSSPNDVLYYYQNYIVVVPMDVNENSKDGLLRLKDIEHLIPDIDE